MVESVNLLRIPFPKETEKYGEERREKKSEKSLLSSSHRDRSTEIGLDRPYSYHQAKDRLRDANHRARESQKDSREDSSRGSKRDRSDRRYDNQPRRPEKKRSRGE